MTDPVKPCPFCGGTLILVVSPIRPAMFCAECGASGPNARNTSEAQEKWQRRDDPDLRGSDPSQTDRQLQETR